MLLQLGAAGVVLLRAVPLLASQLQVRCSTVRHNSTSRKKQQGALTPPAPGRRVLSSVVCCRKRDERVKAHFGTAMSMNGSERRSRVRLLEAQDMSVHASKIDTKRRDRWRERHKERRDGDGWRKRGRQGRGTLRHVGGEMAVRSLPFAVLQAAR